MRLWEGNDMQPKSIKVAVLVAGPASPFTRHLHGDYGDLLINLLRHDVLQFEKFFVYQGHFPPRVHEFDLLMITGSQFDAHGTDPWIVQLHELIRRFYDSNGKMLGICFGHQAIAHALGGRAGRNPSGWECGSFPLRGHNNTLLGPAIDGLAIVEMHQDHVFQLPKQAVVHGETSRTAIQIMTLNERVLGIQGHPEFTADIVQDLLASRYQAGLIGEELFRDGQNSLSLEVSRDAWRKLILDFFGFATESEHPGD